MKIKIVFLSLDASLTFLSNFHVYAAQNLVQACGKEIKSFGCSASDEASAFKCLERYEKENQKNEGFSSACHKAHESYEKRMGRQEQENHQYKKKK